MCLCCPTRQMGPTAATPPRCATSSLFVKVVKERRAMHAAETRSVSEVEGEGRNYHLPIIFLPSVAHPVVGHCTYQLWELKLTARRCPKATERPMAKGADPETSFLLRSVVARTHNTSWKVAMISIPSPWPALIPSESCMETRRKMSPDIPTWLQPVQQSFAGSTFSIGKCRPAQPFLCLGCFCLRGKKKKKKMWTEISFEAFAAVLKSRCNQLLLVIQHDCMVAASSQSECSTTRHNENISGLCMRNKWARVAISRVHP